MDEVLKQSNLCERLKLAEDEKKEIIDVMMQSLVEDEIIDIIINKDIKRRNIKLLYLLIYFLFSCSFLLWDQFKGSVVVVILEFAKQTK